MITFRVIWDMPSKYKRRLGSRKYRDFSEETLQSAIEDIETNNLTYRAAADKYGIPKSTLERKFNKKHMKSPGGQTTLLAEEENILKRAIITASEWGFPLEKEDIKDLVHGYIMRQGKNAKKFRNSRPGDSWYYGFVARHNDLSIRLSENIKRSRAAVSIEILNEYFDNLSTSLKDVPPENILNYDESGFVDDPGRNKVLVRKKSKHAERVMDFSKSNNSVMFCVSGSGETLPPYIVYKADHIWSTWTERGPLNARYNRSKSGWFDMALFEDWFLTIALPYLKKLNGPKVMLGDNLASHISVKVLQECENNGIRFILLPPNSTHLTQPLDVSCFRPIKGAWRKILKLWKRQNRGPLRKDMFPTLLRQTLAKVGSNQSENIKAGFRTTGLIPLDRDAVLNKIPKQDRNPNDKAAENSITETLKDLFHVSRFGNTRDGSASGSSKEIKRKKKLEVAAGQSVSYEQVQKTNEEKQKGIEAEKSKKRKKKNKTIYDLTDSDSADPHEEQSQAKKTKESDSENDENYDITEGKSSDQTYEEDKTSYSDLEIDDFIVVQLKSAKGRSQRFIGQITGKDPYHCSYLKQNSKKTNAYIFPVIQDEGYIEPHEFIVKLPPPQRLRRGGMVFSEIALKKFVF